MTGLQAARELNRRKPELRTLILSMYENEQFLFEALKAGASGYVLKSGADQDIVEACRAAMRGQTFLYPSAVSALVRDFVQRDDEEGAFDPLTPREQEILKLIAEAHPSKTIAQMLTISIKTVERHRANILEKLGMRDRVELTRYAIRRGLVEPDRHRRRGDDDAEDGRKTPCRLRSRASRVVVHQGSHSAPIASCGTNAEKEVRS